MKNKVLVILLLIILIAGCSSSKTVHCEYPKIVVPEPIWKQDITVYYNAESNIFYMNEQSMRNLNIYLIDVHRYVKDSNSIFNVINSGSNN